jgi:hypothetical protein
MNSTIRAYPIPQWVGHGLLLGMVAGLFGLFTPTAWGQGTQAFYCNGQNAVDTLWPSTASIPASAPAQTSATL